MALNRIIEVSIGPEGETGTLIKDLHMNFSVEKSDKESANKLVLQIYNVSLNTSEKIAKARNKIILKAGYSDEGVVNLFFGDITKTTDKKEGVNRILEIEAYDGQTNIQNKDISISYTGGTSKQKIFQDLVYAFGLPLMNPKTQISGSFANGWAFIGKVKEGLTEILSPLNKSWTIQNQQLVIISPGEVVQRSGLKISPKTGLIGTPEALSDQDEKQTENKEVPKRWKIKSLLYPQLFPGSEIQIKSSIVNGTFKIESLNFSGDNYEGDFVCELEVVQI